MAYFFITRWWIKVSKNINESYFSFSFYQGTVKINKHINEAVIMTEGFSNKDTGEKLLQPYNTDRRQNT